MIFLFASVAVAAVPIKLELGTVQAPPGITANWTLIDDCILSLQLRNDTSMPVELDWMRSVYAPVGKPAVGIIPGTSSKFSSMIAIPPTVVPPGAYIEEMLFRKDRLPTESDLGCMTDAASISLSVSGNWLVQNVAFVFDMDEINRQKAAEEARLRAEQDALRQAALIKCEQLSARLNQTPAWIASAAVLGVGLATTAYALQADETQGGLTAVGLIATVGGGGYMISLPSQKKSIQSQMTELGCQ